MNGNYEHVTWSGLERFMHAHDKEHERIDRHINIIHTRMWSILLGVCCGLMVLVGWLATNGPIFQSGGN